MKCVISETSSGFNRIDSDMYIDKNKTQIKICTLININIDTNIAI